jgi:hypothetical protein
MGQALPRSTALFAETRFSYLIRQKKHATIWLRSRAKQQKIFEKSAFSN